MTELQVNSTDFNQILTSDDAIDNEVMTGCRMYAQSFVHWRIWLYMAVSEIRRRYRRTLLGPFWATLSVAIFIGCMGMVFPMLWHTDVQSFLPFFSAGFIVWTFVSTTINDACGTFIDAGNLIKQVNLPYPTYAFSAVTRNFLTMLHHLAVYVPIMLIFHVPINLNTLLFLPAMIILCLTSSWVCVLLGFLTARFRDMKQIISSLLQISIFVTPIFWRPSQLGSSLYAQILVAINPLYHFVEIVRAPLLGQQPASIDWIASIGFCLLGWLLTMKVVGKYYKHLVFWL
ncbi:MAG: ABC transporter permease [Legionellaceae bacterium]|nr:ABC transporter permease [Legionellaceae bacterium]